MERGWYMGVDRLLRRTLAELRLQIYLDRTGGGGGGGGGGDDEDDAGENDDADGDADGAADDTQQDGEDIVSLAELKRLLESKAVTQETMCWMEGFEDWCQISTCQEQLGLLEPTSSTAPASPPPAGAGAGAGADESLQSSGGSSIGGGDGSPEARSPATSIDARATRRATSLTISPRGVEDGPPSLQSWVGLTRMERRTREIAEQRQAELLRQADFRVAKLLKQIERCGGTPYNTACSCTHTLLRRRRATLRCVAPCYAVL